MRRWRGSPSTCRGLDAYDAIILSDIGSNSLLLPPAVWLQSKTVPNRLKLIRAWVEKGGGLLMVGGYFSFQGIDGRARWRRTAVEDALPVTCLPYDDRVEMPEGARRRDGQAGPPDGRRALVASGRRSSASTRSRRASAPTSRSSPACRTTRAAIRCSSPAHSARAAQRPGHRISARTGCRRPSVNGTATAGCGRTSSAG